MKEVTIMFSTVLRILMKNFDNVTKPFESSSTPLLELKNITKEYIDDRGKKIVVLNRINLSNESSRIHIYRWTLWRW